MSQSILYSGSPDISVVKKSACYGEGPSSIPGPGRSSREGIGYPLQYSWISLVTQLVKNQPAIQETWVQSLGWQDALEGKGYPYLYSGLENSMDCIVHGVTKSWTRLSDFHDFIPKQSCLFFFFFLNRRWSSAPSKRRWKWTGAVIKQRQL